MLKNTKVSALADHILVRALPLLYLLIANAFYLRTYDSAQVKITLLQMGGLFLSGLWAVKLLHDGRPVFKREQWPVLAPIFFFLISGIVSFFHSEFRVVSEDEFIRRIFYALFAFMVIREFNSEKKIERTLALLATSTAICAVYGLIQWFDSRFAQGADFGPDPFIWRQAFGGRIFSTFGNPNFFGNFLVIVFPILGSLYLKTKDAFNRMAIGLLIGLVVFCIAYTDTKGAWLGFIAAFTIFAILSMLKLPKQTVQIWRLLVFSLLVFILCLKTLLGNAFWPAVGCLVAFFAIAYFYPKFVRAMFFGLLILALFAAGFVVWRKIGQRVDSARFRIFTWLSTWEMIEQHPWLGSGIGTFKVIYPAYRRPAIFHIEGRHNTETDHAEDEYLEVWYDEGLIGFGIFIWLILSYCLMGYRALTRFSLLEAPSGLSPPKGAPPVAVTDPRAYYMLGFLAALLGMLVHNMMDVSMRFVSSGVYVGLLTGLIGALIVNNPLPVDVEETEAERVPLEAPSGTLWRSVGLALKGAVVLLIGFLCWKLLGSFAEIQGPLAQLSHPGERLQWQISWAVLAPVVLISGWSLGRLVFASRSLLAPLAVAAILFPTFEFWGYFRADMHHNRAIFHSKRQEWDLALDNYFAVNKLNPAFSMAHYFRGNVYNDRWNMEKQCQPRWGDKPGELRDDFERTLSAYDDVATIAPNYVQMHHQRGLIYLKMGERYSQLAQAAKAQGDVLKAADFGQRAELEWRHALTYFEKYFLIDPVFPPNYYRMAWIHVQLREFDKAEQLYLDYLSGKNCQNSHRTGEPKGHEDPEAYTNLGNLRYVRGNVKGAEEAFQKAVAADGNFVNAIRNLAVLYAREGKQNDSLVFWRRLQALKPDDPDVLRVFGPIKR